MLENGRAPFLHDIDFSTKDEAEKKLLQFAHSYLAQILFQILFF